MISTLHVPVDGVIFKSYLMVCIIKEFGDFPFLWSFVSKGGLILWSDVRSVRGNIFYLIF